MNSNLKPHI